MTLYQRNFLLVSKLMIHIGVKKSEIIDSSIHAFTLILIMLFLPILFFPVYYINILIDSISVSTIFMSFCLLGYVFSIYFICLFTYKKSKKEIDERVSKLIYYKSSTLKKMFFSLLFAIILVLILCIEFLIFIFIENLH